MPEISLRSRTSTAARIKHTYDMVAERVITPGEEVFNTYDSRGLSNVNLLCQYGFMLEGNGKDSIEFDKHELSAAFTERKNLQTPLVYDEKEGDLPKDKEMERYGEPGVIATTHSPASAVLRLPSTSERALRISRDYSNLFPHESSSPLGPRVCGPSVAPRPTPGRVEVGVVIDAVRALLEDADLVQRQSNPLSNLYSSLPDLDPAKRLEVHHSKSSPYADDKWGEKEVNWESRDTDGMRPRAALRPSTAGDVDEDGDSNVLP